MSERSDSSRGPRVPERAQGAVAALGLVALVGAVFPGAWLGDGVFYQRDILSYWYPHIEVFVRVIGEGEWPLWNPYVTFGTPLLADPNLQLAYPPTWLNLALLPATYFKLFVLLHCVGGGFGAWLLARRLRLGPLPAFLVAGSWAACGPLLSSVSLFHHFAGAAWIPWVLWALDRALDRRTVASGLLLGAVAAGQLLAGSADMAFMTALAAAGAVTAFVLGGRPGTADGRPERLRVVARLVPLALVYATLLSAVQWWPTIAHVASGLRLGLEPRVSLYWSLHPASLVDMVVPGLVAGLPLGDAARQALFEGRGPLLASVYLGLPALALVTLALLRGRRRLVWLLSAGFVLFLLAALGRHTPFLPALLELPVFGVFRYPQKYLLPAGLLWALLAGLGLDRFAGEEPGGGRRGVLVVGLGFVTLAALAAGLAVWAAGTPPALSRALSPTADAAAAALAASGRLWAAAGLALVTGALFLARWRLAGPRPGLTLALLLLAVGDLAVAGRPVNPLAPPELLRHRPVVLEGLETGGASPRFHVLNQPRDWLREQRERASRGGPPELEAALGTVDRLTPPTGARWGAGGSYDGSFTGMAPPELSLLSVTAQRTRDSRTLVRLLRMGSVDYVVTLEDLSAPGLTEVGRYESVFAEPIRLLRVGQTLPRSYLVGRAATASGAELVSVLLDPRFDPRREVVLVEPGDAEPSLDFRGEARTLRRTAGRIELEVAASAPGYVVVTDSWDPGWRARIDGAPADVLQANLLFCAVPVPAGRHRVELRYRSPAAAWGLTATALAIALGLVAWERGRRRRAADRDSPPAT